MALGRKWMELEIFISRKINQVQKVNFSNIQRLDLDLCQ